MSEQAILDANSDNSADNTAELSALYDKLTADDDLGTETSAEPVDADDTAQLETPPPEGDDNQPDEQGAAEVADVEGKNAKVDAPQGLPADLSAQWADMPEAARAAVLADRDQLHRRLSEAGRQIQGIGPIRDVLTKAVTELPALSGMKPEEAASEIFKLAVASNNFREKPVETMMGLIKQQGLEQAVAEALGGQDVSAGARGTAELNRQIADLQRQVATLSSEEFLTDRVSQITTQKAVLSEVSEFARTAEHWGQVENVLDAYVPAARAKLGESAAPRAVLELAYKRAVEDFVDSKASDMTASGAIVNPDPEKTAKAIKAKSVNISGRSTGRARVLTEREELAAAYDRAMGK